MTRFLCFTLLLLIAFPLFAQDEPAPLGQPLPRDPALLMRMRDQLAFELRETQRALSFINPNDTQLVETLRTRQTDLARQMNDITGQLQTLGPNPNIGDVPPGMGRPGMLSPGQTAREQELQRTETLPPGYTPAPPGYTPASPMIPGYPPIQQPPNRSDLPPYLLPTYPPSVPYNQADMIPNNVPLWGNQEQAWEATPWGPRLPKELTEMKQSVESLQKDIAELRTTIKALETQIQLLNRTILLERTNGRQSEPVREE